MLGRTHSQQKVGYALEGGGGMGGFQAGGLYQMKKFGLEPDVISGISVGSLNGILVALGEYELMRQIWFEIEDHQVRGARGLEYGWNFAMHKLGLGKPMLGYWDNKPLKKLVRFHILGKTTRVDFYTGVVNVERDMFKHIKIPKGTTFTKHNVDEYVDYIVASTAIPIVFQPVRIHGELYVDGGVHNQTPISQVKQVAAAGTEFLYTFSMQRDLANNRTYDVKDDIDMVRYVISSLLEQQREQDLKVFKMYNQLAQFYGGTYKDKVTGKEYRNIPYHIFKPEKKLAPSTRFHWKYSKLDFKHGQDVVRRYTDSLSSQLVNG